jgi:histidinol phosphatase-like enzyme (inositol monophosphatase family)
VERDWSIGPRAAKIAARVGLEAGRAIWAWGEFAMQPSELSQRLELTRRMAVEAGELTLRYFQQAELAVETKRDNSPVTVADREAEQLLRKRIGEAFPDDGILGEEFGEQAGRSGFRWILDPIDGTKSFIHGVPLYGTLIGIEYQRQSVVGMIHIPALNESVYAAVGQGAWYVAGEAPPRPTQVNTAADLSTSLLCTSEVEGFRKVDRWSVFERLQSSVALVRTWGDCYGYLLVATGRAEVMVDPRMQVWDAAALQPILTEAGGVFTDWQGEPTIFGGNGIATNRRLLDSVVAMTRTA